MAALGVRTALGGCTVASVTQYGVDVAGAPVGAVAGDEECYDALAPVFGPIITALHGPPRPYVGDTDASGLKGRLSDKFVRSVRVRVIRNIRGFPLPAAISRSDRRDVERLLLTAMAKLSGDEFACKYAALSTMAPELRSRLVGEGVMFPDPADGGLVAHGGAARDWPDGRGVFVNEARSLLVWVNEEDHVRVIAARRGPNLAAAFESATRAVAALDAALIGEERAFALHARLGYVASCPSNLGTGLRAAAVVELPQCARAAGFDGAVAALGLRATAHEDAPPGVGRRTLSTVACMGMTEVAIAQTLLTGVARLCELEAMLQAGVKVDIATAARVT
jgi:creatine kinase